MHERTGPFLIHQKRFWALLLTVPVLVLGLPRLAFLSLATELGTGEATADTEDEGTPDPEETNVTYADPEELEYWVIPDGLEQGDSDQTVGYRILYSVDDGANWTNGLEGEVELDDEGYYFMPAEDVFNWDIHHPGAPFIVQGAGDTVKVRVDFKSTPLGDGYATKKIIAVGVGAQDDPEEPEEPYEHWLGWSDSPSDDLDNAFNDLSCIYTFHPASDEKRDLHPTLVYPDAGSPEIVEEAKKYLYAFDPEAIQDNLTDTEKYAELLATELYGRFIRVSMFENFGLPVFDLYDPEITMDDYYWAVHEMVNREKVKFERAGDPITVHKADGTTETRACNIYTVEWGYDEFNGAPIVSHLPVYELADMDELLICTDWNDSTGTGTTFYSRTRADEVSCFGERDAALVVVADNYTNAKVGGNYANIFPSNEDGIYAAQAATDDSFNLYFEGLGLEPYGMNLRVLKAGNTYVAATGEGETKAYGGLGPNGVRTDPVWATGDDMSAYVYIGDSTIYLQPLNNIGASTYAITDVDFREDAAWMSEGVTIDKTDLTKIKLTFASNYYSEIPLVITYTGGVTKEITIKRIGLVFSYRYLGGATDFDEGERIDRIWVDSIPGGEVEFTYNYFAGEQIVIWATYYHPTKDAAEGSQDLSLFLTYDDGSTRLLEHEDADHNWSGYIAGNDDAVDATLFLIGFAPAKIFDGNVWVDNITEQYLISPNGGEGGVSAMVLNNGFDSEETFGGTQIGSGSGVYWDGLITWF